jgi:small subunit ribosomal protein S20
MANHKSAKKRIRQTARRNEVNGARRSAIRTFIKKVETAITAGDKAAAGEALKAAEPQMMRGAQKGVFDKKTMSRKLSRLSATIKAISA